MANLHYHQQLIVETRRHTYPSTSTSWHALDRRLTTALSCTSPSRPLPALTHGPSPAARGLHHPISMSFTTKARPDPRENRLRQLRKVLNLALYRHRCHARHSHSWFKRLRNLGSSNFNRVVPWMALKYENGSGNRGGNAPLIKLSKVWTREHCFLTRLRLVNSLSIDADTVVYFSLAIG